MSGLDNALQNYSKKVVNQLGKYLLIFFYLINQCIYVLTIFFSCIGAKEDFLPTRPSLTRYGKETTSIKTFSKKKPAEPRNLDDRRSSQLNLLTVSQLCVRLNTLHVRPAHTIL